MYSMHIIYVPSSMQALSYVWEWYAKEARIKVPRDNNRGLMDVASFLVLLSDSQNNAAL